MLHLVRARITELSSFYDGPEFKECNAASRGYHLVRALDEELYKGLFSPWKPEVSYISNGPNEITVYVDGYGLDKFKITFRDTPNE